MKKPAFKPPVFILSRLTWRSAVAGSTLGVAKSSGMSSCESSVISGRAGGEGAAVLALRPSFGAQAHSRVAAAAAINLREVSMSTSSARRFVRQVVFRVDGAHERVRNEGNGQQPRHQVHRQ